MTNFLKSLNPIKNNEVNIIWIGLFLFILSVTGSWSKSTIASPDILKFYVASFGVTVLVILGLYCKCKTSDVDLKINFIKLSLTLLFVLGTMSIIWSINFDFSLSKWLLWTIGVFSFILSLNLTLTNKNLIKLAWCLIISGATISIIGLYQHYSNPFHTSLWPPSSFGNKNFATHVLVLVFPISFFLLFSKLIQGYKVWLVQFASFLIITYIILTFTRAAWLSISVEFLCIAIYFMIRRYKVIEWIDWNKNKRNSVVTALLLTITLVSLSPPYELSNIWMDILQKVTLTASASDISSLNRFEIWQTGVRMFFEKPFFGSGLGSFSQNIANEGYATANINNTLKAHNDLIELSVELGLVGLIVFFMVIISLVMGVFYLLKKTSREIHLFFLFISIGILGSFVNLQFSSPYQMAFPVLLFGLYSGLIANQIDFIIEPPKRIKFSLSGMYKKILLVIFSIFIFIIFFFTHFQSISTYGKLDKIINLNGFNQLEDMEISFDNNYIQATLYFIGGKSFNNGNYLQSKVIDEKFLQVWPNHLDVLYRLAYAEHKLGKNDVALNLVKKLKKIEPDGLYNAYIVEMFIYLHENNLIKFEKTFNELLLKSEELLKVNENTYRMMIYFTLHSKKLSAYAPFLYSKYIENSVNYEYKDGTYYDRICEVENNIAINYFNQEKYEDSANIINKVSNKNLKCFNTDLIKLLNDKGLLDIQASK
jgi:O-antigen ligase